MDKFKQKTIINHTAWDIDCKYCTRNWNDRNKKLKNKFRRVARKELKEELRKEIING